MEFRAFSYCHLAALRLQQAQDYLQPVIETPSYGLALEVPGLAYSGVIDGQVVGCAGILPQAPWRAIAWALLSQEIPARCWPTIHRLVLRVLDEAHLRGYHRVEAVVDADFDAGIRWAEMLGMRCETPQGMRGWGPEGGTHLMFSSVRIE